MSTYDLSIVKINNKALSELRRAELRIETGMIDVSSALPRPDPAWSHIDEAGHFHSWSVEDDGKMTLPTLRETWDFNSDGDGLTFAGWNCRACKADVTPGKAVPAGPELIPGRMTWELTIAGRGLAGLRTREIVSLHAATRGGHAFFGLVVFRSAYKTADEQVLDFDGTSPLGRRKP